MLTLKPYQRRALACLKTFFIHCQNGPCVSEAFACSLSLQHKPKVPYSEQGFGEVPYVCLRVPTGGGKTLLATHTIPLAATYCLQTDAPLVLWLVPTRTIAQQTVAALQMPQHPCRQFLERTLNCPPRVLPIAHGDEIRAQDVGHQTLILVSTLANLRVQDTTGRKVYAYREAFEPHFAHLDTASRTAAYFDHVTPSDVQPHGLSDKDVGAFKYSLANLLAWQRPLIIVDEAHNARTKLTFDTLQRFRPRAIIEWTATPNTSQANGSNVLFHVCASELKSAEMIKLPIVLTEHTSWQQAVTATVATRQKLEKAAKLETQPVRPLALLQAEPKNGQVTVAVLRNYLIDTLRIAPQHIAIATGTQRELDGINLFDPHCQIAYIITIEALKEGWDCAFAYVFCSVKPVSSSKDAEQLLGRVLRMPYAKKRMVADLNRAYAHLATPQFGLAAKQLTDRLIAMGFEAMEVATLLRQAPQQGELLSQDAKMPTPPQVAPLVMTLPQAPNLSALSETERAPLTLTPCGGSGAVARITGIVDDPLAQVLLKTYPNADIRAQWAERLQVHNATWLQSQSPAACGAKFSPIPLVACRVQGEKELAEPPVFLNAADWNLQNCTELPTWHRDDQHHCFSIDMEGKQLRYRMNTDHIWQPALFPELPKITCDHLVAWLDRQLQQPDIPQTQLIAFLSRVVNGLLQSPAKISLRELRQHKFVLARMIADIIARYRKKAQEAGYQALLFDNPHVQVDASFTYTMHPEHYPSRPPYYQGHYAFQKHYFPYHLIEDLHEPGEEFLCAQTIDQLDAVQYWIRNLVKRDAASFWLPLATQKFYPDFVCQLHDGRILVVEYKGALYASNDDSAAKQAVGQLWASHSQGTCLFVMVVAKDASGQDMRAQLLRAINGDCVDELVQKRLR